MVYDGYDLNSQRVALQQTARHRGDRDVDPVPMIILEVPDRARIEDLDPGKRGNRDRGRVTTDCRLMTSKPMHMAMAADTGTMRTAVSINRVMMWIHRGTAYSLRTLWRVTDHARASTIASTLKYVMTMDAVKWVR